MCYYNNNKRDKHHKRKGESKMLSTVVKTVVIVVMTVVGAATVKTVDNTVTRDAEVYQINDEVVTFEDSVGNLWDWEIEEGESFEEGQKVRLIMDMNETVDIIEDDVILKIRLDN